MIRKNKTLYECLISKNSGQMSEKQHKAEIFEAIQLDSEEKSDLDFLRIIFRML